MAGATPAAFRRSFRVALSVAGGVTGMGVGSGALLGLARALNSDGRKNREESPPTPGALGPGTSLGRKSPRPMITA